MAAAGKNLRTLAQTMTEFAFALRYDSIPPEVKAVARLHLADTLACALGARDTATVHALKEHALAPSAAIVTLASQKVGLRR